MVKRPQTFKYLGLIRTLVAGIAADVLRMRLLKAANDNLMSIKKFLSYWKVNICTEVATNTELLSQVFPESGQPEDLAAWNTGLLCLVLQTCECLSARETDDISYVYQLYRKYFLRRPVSISRRRNTKAEWISLCDAVQRLAEDVDDTEMLKAVRNFMCEVEMDNTKKETRQNTQQYLKTMTNEGAQYNPFSKYKNRNMTDDAKAKLSMSHDEINFLGKKKDRPKSASAKLIDGRELKKTSDSKSDQGDPRPRSAEAKQVYNNPSRISLRKGQGHISKSALFYKREGLNTTLQMTNSDSRLHKKKSWPKSSKEKLREYRAIYGSPRRTQSAREYCRRSVSNVAKERRAKSANTLLRKAPTIEATGDMLVNVQEKQRKILAKTDETFASEEQRSKQEVLRKDPYAKYQRQTPNNSSRFNGTIKKRMLMQQKQNKRLPKPLETDKLESMKQKILMQNPSLLNVEAIDESAYKQNGRHIHKIRVVYRQKLKNMEEIKGEYKEQDGIRQESEDEVSHLENNNSFQGQQDTRKTAVFDENMKQIANEVLVHQNMHRAARNPYLANKEFVDGFFAFSNENQVTKEFLRTESPEPEQTLRLPDGCQIHLTFFLAFIFRHVESCEMEMVKYVVEKMLLRVECIHDRISDTSETTTQNKYIVEKNVTDLYSTPVDQNSKSHYSARTGVLPQFVQSNPQRLKHKSAHLNKKTFLDQKQHSVYHSQRSQREMLKETGFVGKKRVKRFLSRRQSRNCPEISTLLGRQMYVHSSHRERLERVPTRKVSSDNKRQSRPRKRSPQLSRRENGVADRSLSATGSDKVARRKSRSGIIRTNVLDDSTCIPHKLLRSYSRKNSSPNLNTCSLNMVNLNRKESEPESDKASDNMLTSISDKTKETERVYNIIKNNAKDVTLRGTDFCQKQRCWKCAEKELAMSLCVNWGNSVLCEMMNSEGVPYKVDHIMAAVKAKDILTLRNIVQFLKGTDEWNPESQSVKDALLFAKQNRMQNITLFLHEEGVHEYEHKFANHDSCIPCFVK